MSPKITAVEAPEFDGYSMTVKWSHNTEEIIAPGASPILNSTMYNYQVEYRPKNDANPPNWQKSGKVILRNLPLRSMLVPFHEYEFRVFAKPVMGGFWSEPSDIIVAKTTATEPTALLNPKYSILSFNHKTLRIKFFLLSYQQQNAPNNRFRIRIKTRNCNEEYQKIRTILDDLIENPTVTSHEIQLNVANIQCINAEFVVENDKGATLPEIIPIDIYKGNFRSKHFFTSFSFSEIEFNILRKITFLLSLQ